MTTIRKADLIQSVADALQFISYYHPADYIAALGDATTVVTDGGLEPAAFAILDEAVAQVLVADEATTPDAADPEARRLRG